jgi:hypothetical protein
MDSILTTQFLGPTEISRNKAMSTAPSQYWPGWTTVSKLHNFSDRKGTGSLTTIWPLAPWITICPHQIFIPSAGTVLVVKRRRSSVCRLAPEGSTLLYVCMYAYVPMYVCVCCSTWRVHKGALSHECLSGENIISALQYIRIYFCPSAKTIFIANTRGVAKTPNEPKINV